MAEPAHWRRLKGSGSTRAAGPAVVFDLDGIISDASHRQHFLRRPRQDWQGFFTAAADDPPLRAGLGLVASVAAAAAAAAAAASASATAATAASASATAATAAAAADSGAAAAAAAAAESHEVIICTARPHYVADITCRWLAAHDVRADLLIMRRPGDRSSSAAFKRREVRRLRLAGYQIELAIDDDPRVVDMYRSEGVFALYRHSGYYDR